MYLPLDLKRVAQVNAKVYITNSRQFGNVDYYGADIVKINIGTSKVPSYIDMTQDEFHSKLLDDLIVAKARVKMSDDEASRVSIKPRVIMEEPPQTSLDGSSITKSDDPVVITRLFDNKASIQKPEVKQELLTGYIDERTGKFSSSLQTGMIEIHYYKVTRKVELELDSVQLAKLRELGIIE